MLPKQSFRFAFFFLFCISVIGCSINRSSPTPGDVPKSQGSTLPVKEAWCKNFTAIVSHPTYYHGFVYVFQEMQPEAETKAIIAYNLSGNEVWKQEVESRALPGYWFIQDGYLVTGTTVSVTVFNAMTGEKLW